MYIQQMISIAIYTSLLFLVGFSTYKRNQSSDDYIIGGRSLNFWLTAFAAHASDMSSWLFMGFPAVIYMYGLFDAWNAVGLIVFMFLNWQFIAPKIRIKTEEYNALTFSSFFESRVSDTSGLIRIFTAIISLIFYSIYISAGLVGLGLLIESLFQINYYIGITVGMCIVIPYLFIGGYSTLAWIDLFQGLFLMCVIIFVPIYAVGHLGGIHVVSEAIRQKGLSLSFIPSYDAMTFLKIFLAVGGWGLGYFGQPHIVTKFMGIKNVKDTKKAKYVGITWQLLTMTAATCVGLIAIAYFQGSTQNPETIFIDMVRGLFFPMISAFILCAVLAATISTMDSQILVLASSLAEDFYKRIFRKDASSKEILLVSRLSVLLISLIAFTIAFFKISTIYSLVLYAWSGLGSAFGPLLIFSLYAKRINKYGAWAGILSGGLVSLFWPYTDGHFAVNIPTLFPGFITSCLFIYLFSFIPHKPKKMRRT